MGIGQASNSTSTTGTTRSNNSGASNQVSRNQQSQSPRPRIADTVSLTGRSRELGLIRDLAYKAGFARNTNEVFRLAQDAANFYINNQNLTPVSYQGEVRDFRVITTLKSNNFHFAKVSLDLLAELQNNPSDFALYLLDTPINGGGDTWISALKKNPKDAFTGITNNAPKEVKEALSKLPSNATNGQAIELMQEYAISRHDLSAYAALDASVSRNITSFGEFADRASKIYIDIVTQNYEGIENMQKSTKFTQPTFT